MFGLPKRQVPKPELIGPHRTPSVHTIDGEQAAKIRRTVWLTLVTMAAIAGIGLVTYGPVFRITTVTVSGTQVIIPNSIKTATEVYLNRNRWLIVPNRTLWVVSSGGLESYLQKLIQQRLSIEGIRVEKQRPHTLNIRVTERTAVAMWSNGTQLGALDRHGVIIDLRTEAAANLPTVHDLNTQPFTVDSSVVKREVVSALTELGGDLKAAHIDVDEYQIPVPVCPVETPVVTDTNANVSRTTNTNTSVRNTNTTNTNTVTTPTTTAMMLPPCDLQALRYSSQEIYVKLKEGPLVYFDRQNDIRKAVQTLQRVLSQTGGKTYTTIDVRFGDRVFVK